MAVNLIIELDIEIKIFIFFTFSKLSIMFLLLVQTWITVFKFTDYLAFYLMLLLRREELQQFPLDLSSLKICFVKYNVCKNNFPFLHKTKKKMMD